MENHDEEIKAMITAYELLLKKYDDAFASDKSFEDQLTIFREIKNFRTKLSMIGKKDLRFVSQEQLQ